MARGRRLELVGGGGGGDESFADVTMSHTEREGKASSHHEYYHIGKRAFSLIQNSLRGIRRRSCSF